MQGALVQRSAASMWSGYCSMLERRPLLTKAATGIVGSLVGDGIAQYGSRAARVRRGDDAPAGYDAARAARLCAYAAVVGTPIGHYWFAFLDKFIWPSAMGHPMTAVAKTLLDQAIMAPAGIALFFATMHLLEHGFAAQQQVGSSSSSSSGGGLMRALRDAADAARAKLPSTLLANYMLWPAANLVNFAFVPPAQRILYVNVVYVFWASYLSTAAAAAGAGAGATKRKAGQAEEEGEAADEAAAAKQQQQQLLRRPLVRALADNPDLAQKEL